MINKVILVGNVGIDPEVRAIESGVKVARVRLATTERIFNRQTNESTEHTEWHTVILWRGLADVVDRFVRKGSQLYIEGSLRTREWMDKENQKRYTTEIIASDMKLLGKRSDNPAGGQSAVISRRAGFRADMPRPHRRRAGMRNPRHSPCSPPPLRSFRRRRIPTICRSEARSSCGVTAVLCVVATEFGCNDVFLECFSEKSIPVMFRVDNPALACDAGEKPPPLLRRSTVFAEVRVRPPPLTDTDALIGFEGVFAEECFLSEPDAFMS